MKELLQFAHEIASGMAHLEALGVVHSNLAAFVMRHYFQQLDSHFSRRTVLVTGNQSCKLADIGLQCAAYGGVSTHTNQMMDG